MLGLLSLVCIIGLLHVVFLVLQSRAKKHEQNRFSSDSESPYARMTTMERVVAGGLYPRFAAAASERDVDAMIGILLQVEIGRHESVTIAERIVADPVKFGFDPLP